MGFEPGHKKHGGRKAGTPNRSSTAVRELVEAGLGKSIPERLLELTTEVAWHAETELKTLLVLMPYCYPRLAAVQFQASVDERDFNVEIEAMKHDLEALDALDTEIPSSSFTAPPKPPK